MSSRTLRTHAGHRPLGRRISRATDPTHHDEQRTTTPRHAYIRQSLGREPTTSPFATSLPALCPERIPGPGHLPSRRQATRRRSER
eukprot:1712300-Pyramimonas_sp.AAC.1